MSMQNEKIQRLQEMTDESKRIVFFGGAGVSTESGIKDFRSQDGLYNQKYPYPPETILSRTFYDKEPEWFYRFYREKMICPDAKPNPAHLKLAELEEKGKLYPYVYLLKQWKFDLWIIIIACSSIARYGLLTWIPTYYVEVLNMDIPTGNINSVCCVRTVFCPKIICSRLIRYITSVSNC